MSVYTVTRCFSFDAAHRVLGHQGKCRHLHGHTYGLEVTFGSHTLDHLGMVVDFGDVKKLLADLVAELDHNTILHRHDPLLRVCGTAADEDVWNGKRPVVLTYNPTAENLAFYVATNITNELPPQAAYRLMKVKVSETAGCWAEYVP